MSDANVVLFALVFAGIAYVVLVWNTPRAAEHLAKQLVARAAGLRGARIAYEKKHGALMRRGQPARLRADSLYPDPTVVQEARDAD